MDGGEAIIRLELVGLTDVLGSSRKLHGFEPPQSLMIFILSL